MKGKRSHKDIFFQNTADFFTDFQGLHIRADHIKLTDFTGLNVAIIDANQHAISLLHLVCQQAAQVKVFQIRPPFVLPGTEKGIQKIIAHPLISKNRRLFSQNIKTMLAIRHLESQVSNNWMKRQLMPNSASHPKVFFKSDHYYQALQAPNCQLITWPIIKIDQKYIHTMDKTAHKVDVIITTFD